MNKILSALAIAAGLSACAAPQPPASQNEIAVARGKYQMCLVPYAARFDDGLSDARTIANAMVGACPDQYNELFDTITRNDNGRVKRMLHERRSQAQSDIALEVVLDMRARRR